MKIITTASEMLAYSNQSRLNGRVISFVPTMGALHNGHISLVENAKRANAIVVVSVFVNPTQFNDSSDLESYPRTIDCDTRLLQLAGADAMFYPTVEEVYPAEEKKVYEMDGLDERMEGPKRPGHFDGVVQVVTRLFDMVNPDYAFFGEKDFQQLAIIRLMSAKLGYKTEIIACATIREDSGLALSSRNARLSNSGKEIAACISQTLYKLKKELSDSKNIDESLQNATDCLNKIDGLELEYLELVDTINLQTATDESPKIQACVAAHVEDVRLIDNMIVK